MTHRVLVLSPHTDDAELACGGYIKKLRDQGNDVYHIAFSSMLESKYKANNVYESEFREAGYVLDVRTFVYNIPMRTFPENRQDILDILVGLKGSYAPSIVLLPSSFDTHQDHEVIRREGFRAFKDSTIMGYETPWNNVNFQTNCFVPLTDEQMNKKIEAIMCYKSQITNYKYFDEEYVRGLARSRGMQIGTKHAEAFEVIRWVL